jgi:drug/metabolite transporter (DMT)-like permease
MYLLPVVAIALGWLALREPITLIMAAGTTPVLVGVALAQRRHSQPTCGRRRRGNGL